MPISRRSRLIRPMPWQCSTSAASIGTAEIGSRRYSFGEEQWSSFRIMNSRPDFGVSFRFPSEGAWCPGGAV